MLCKILHDIKINAGMQLVLIICSITVEAEKKAFFILEHILTRIS